MESIVHLFAYDFFFRSVYLLCLAIYDTTQLSFEIEMLTVMVVDQN